MELFSAKIFFKLVAIQHDSTLRAAHCFFIHQRSDFIREQYEAAGVPMFDDGAELAAQVLHYLETPDERARIALAAHQRAVPAFSADARAGAIENILCNEFPDKKQPECAV